jgi:hypothetical protein
MLEAVPLERVPVGGVSHRRVFEEPLAHEADLSAAEAAEVLDEPVHRRPRIPG